jgi:ATP-dependent DNA helicase RecQ
MLRFVDCRSCRHRFILEYFGEDTTGFHCPGCDHCPSSDCPPLSDAQYVFVQKVLSCVARMKGRFGPKRIAQVLTGDDDPTLEERGLTALSTYGILQHTQPRLIYDVLDRLADAGCIDVSNDSYHLMAITPKGVAAAKRMLAGFTIPWPSR